MGSSEMLLLATVSVAGGFVLKGHNFGTGATNAMSTNSFTSAGANLIVVGFSEWYQNTRPTVSDNQSHTPYLAAGYSGANDDNRSELWYFQGGSGYGAGCIATITALDPAYALLCAAAFSGALASPLDKQSTQNVTATTVTSITLPSITTTTAQLIITVLSAGASSSAPVVPTGYTMLDSSNGVGGTNFLGAMAYKIQSSAGPENPTWSWTGASRCSACLASFKAA